MKIFMLVSSFPDNNNRSRGIFNYRFVKQLIELRQEVFVVFFRMWTPRRKIISSYTYNDIKVTQICLPLIPLSNFYFLRVNIIICSVFGLLLLRKQLRLSNVIHSVFLTNSGIIAGFWAKKLNKPHIAQAIGSDVNSDLHLFIQKKYVKWIKNINGIITNSRQLEKTIKSFMVNCPRVETIYRGIAINNQLEKATISNEDETRFLYLGGLELNKSLEFGINTKGGITLMKAWKKVENELHSKKAKLFFGGPNSDNIIFKNWKNSLKFPESVEVIGKIDPEQVNNYLLNIDMVIIPSMEEGVPNFLMESASRKRAAIGSTAGGIPEVIVPGVTGYIFEKGNAEQLEKFLLLTAGNNEVNKKMGEAAFDHVRTHFNANNYSNNIIAFYEKILKKCVE